MASNLLVDGEAYKQIGQKISLLREKEFQKKIGDLFISVDGTDFTPAKEAKDKGLDCYNLKTKSFYAMYAPEKYDKNKTIAKIKDDYSKFVDFWQKLYPFEKWFFVTREDLTGETHTAILELGKLDDGIEKASFGLHHIIGYCRQCDPNTLFTLFGFDRYLISQIEARQFGRISEIINNIASNIRLGELPEQISSKDHNFINIKIKNNFTNSEDRADAIRSFKNFNNSLLLVDQVFESDKNRDFIIETVRSAFSEQLNGSPNQKIQNFNNLRELARSFIPSKYHADPDYFPASLALVLRIFEKCDIGFVEEDFSTLFY